MAWPHWQNTSESGFEAYVALLRLIPPALNGSMVKERIDDQLQKQAGCRSK